jgi:hypothetical protein
MASHTTRRGRRTRSGIALHYYPPLSHMGTARPNPKALLYAEPRHLHDRATALNCKQGSQHGLTTHNFGGKVEGRPGISSLLSLPPLQQLLLYLYSY